MGMICHGMKPREWGKSVAQASKAGRLGKMSLKSTLSILSMAGAMALFSSIDSALAPDDLLGCQWLASEKADYLAEMAKCEPSWYSKPWTISGSIICFAIMFVGGSLGLCWSRDKKKRNEGESADGHQEREMKQLRVVERDIITNETEKIRFKEVDLEKMKLEADV